VRQTQEEKIMPETQKAVNVRWTEGQIEFAPCLHFGQSGKTRGNKQKGKRLHPDSGEITMAVSRSILTFLAIIGGSGCCSLVSGVVQDKPKLKLSAAEQKLVDLTNQERKKEKLPPLQRHAILFATSRAHAANMAKQGKMAHVLDGKDVYQRLDKAGYNWRIAGENLGQTRYATPEEVMAGWMKSPGHRKNILNRKFKHIGIGIVQDGKERIYYAVVFGDENAAHRVGTFDSRRFQHGGVADQAAFYLEG
jgi:uncharacterized protein YkwD